MKPGLAGDRDHHVLRGVHGKIEGLPVHRHHAVPPRIDLEAAGLGASHHDRSAVFQLHVLGVVGAYTHRLVGIVEQPSTMGVASAWAAAALLGRALLSTVLLQVPLHRRLAEDHDDAAARRLIATNWIRTAAWTTRGIVLAATIAT